ncbi:hypothetical protein PHYBLDRAFT_152523 [Phycomyces blakesleeanus NRRL 1555(-)]|uniref:MAGE domain-containing protein n=1 Tax=Phycomyces blakesleeanus (strain ATCC 8743b / DSM 1359 / FGSC 10004 / NBRC 33097 / NRRL 1555) TaxID=763407 RepID=A0A162ZFI0_PHYB8|nr:hypothetical protein PHYBLDRAFT_152523 [Phycomyces blakesleeanus NRRL 1555(-)]OAD66451.1 hypothetical protein PHYBLDRAFT_152523 [Phycomyces blakesleeanus NRRL 1555(-)]|eukprot:XP_018284491.1 hypothetical protein PHYBLDRAFT_152523 [Phycomyces blakesleeanus NRRL 1555(-)]
MYTDSQRLKGKQRHRPDTDNEEEYSQQPSQRLKYDDSTVNWNEEEFQRKVKDTVRLALACEFKKTAIKRDDINKKVLQDHKFEFKRLHRAANDKLRYLFGFEMVDLPVKEKILAGSRRDGKEVPGSGSKGYMLLNALPEKYNVPELFKYKDEEYENVGVLYCILALIFVNEQTLSKGELEEHLNRLHVTDETQTFGDRDKLLDNFVKQGYLLRKKNNLAANDPNADPDAGIEYYWGPKAKVEIPEENIVNFITSVYNPENTNINKLTEYVYKSAGFSVP